MPTRYSPTCQSAGVEDEYQRADFADESLLAQMERPHTTLSERVESAGYMSSSTRSVSSRHSQDTGEYEMSVVNDSGVYLPLSTTDDGFFLPRGYRSRASTDTWSSGPSDNEPPFLSRVSLDSFHRSFDIRAKSPIHSPSSVHVSLSAGVATSPRCIGRGLLPQLPTKDEYGNFESVSLSENSTAHGNAVGITASEDKHRATRRRGFFAKFGGGCSDEEKNIPTNKGGSGSKSDGDDCSGASRSHDGWSQARSEWSPWARDTTERGADNHGSVAIAFRGAGGAVLRR